MATKSSPEKSLRWVLLFLALAAVLAGLQFWNSISINDVVRSAQTSANPSKDKSELELERERQDLISKRIENESRGALSISLTAGLSAAVAAFGTILGAVLALRGYLDAREKERQDRLDASEKEINAREKERQDRLAAALNDTLTRLVSSDWRQRVVGAAGLLPFFTKDRTEFHLQALAALVAAARIEGEEAVVSQGIRLAVERAARTADPRSLAEVSWQGVRIAGVNLEGTNLSGLDFRDSVLENAKLSAANLKGADLSAAKLQGARLDKAVLENASLAFADLAGATLSSAILSGASLSGAKVLNLDLQRADFRSIGDGWRDVPWDATKNWREALFDDAVGAELTRLYGRAAPKLRVLMLMWELPPMVAGGTWTACYHLVRNLRRRGADVTVVVPWSRQSLILEPPPFGTEVPIVTLDIEVSDAVGDSAWSPYSNFAVPGPYRRASSFAQVTPYMSWSPYGSGAMWSGYTSALSQPYNNPYGGIYGIYGAGSLAGSVLFRLIGAFTRRLKEYVAANPTDLIHAHDWVTFDAARTASERAGVPWVAHFHSTEAERQPGSADPLTERIEQGAVDSATSIVAVSQITRRTIAAKYDPNQRHKIDVVPNSFSEGAPAPSEMGRFETHRVVFLGRLSRQKGVDRFCEVAQRVRGRPFTADFIAYGDGPDRWLLHQRGISAPGPLSWDRRGVAFRGASALVVPSRFEPFGMVILEAMQHRVPVIYPSESGAAEVLQSGVKVDSADTAAMADAVVKLLGDLGNWEQAVARGAKEIEQYRDRDYPDRLMAVWSESKVVFASAPKGPGH